MLKISFFPHQQRLDLWLFEGICPRVKSCVCGLSANFPNSFHLSANKLLLKHFNYLLFCQPPLHQFSMVGRRREEKTSKSFGLGSGDYHLVWRKSYGVSHFSLDSVSIHWA